MNEIWYLIIINTERLWLYATINISVLILCVHIFPFMSSIVVPKRVRQELESEMTGTQQDREREQKVEQGKEAQREIKTAERMWEDFFFFAKSVYLVRNKRINLSCFIKLIKSIIYNMGGQVIEEKTLIHFSGFPVSLS